MMKPRDPGLLVVTIFMTVICIIQGLYWYFGEKLSFSQTLMELGTEVVNVILVYGFALLCVFVFWVICKHLFKK